MTGYNVIFGTMLFIVVMFFGALFLQQIEIQRLTERVDQIQLGHN